MRAREEGGGGVPLPDLGDAGRGATARSRIDRSWPTVACTQPLFGRLAELQSWRTLSPGGDRGVGER